MKLMLAAKNSEGEVFFFADGTSMDEFYKVNNEEAFPFIGAQPFVKGAKIFDSCTENEREFYNMLTDIGIDKNEAKEFLETDESKELDAAFQADIEKMIEEGVLKRLTPEEIEEIRKKNAEEEAKLAEMTWSQCPRCGTNDRGQGTVMNGIDEVIQVPLLLKRLDIEKHSHIIACHHCGAWYEVSSGKTLTRDEMIECDKLWNELRQEEK